MGDYEPVTEQFIFPLHIFVEVMNLLKPQNCAIGTQTRWVMVNNVKMLPVQMKFEFTEGKKYVKAEIKMAKIKIEVDLQKTNLEPTNSRVKLQIF